MWCCDDWWAHACGGTAAAGRSLSRFSLRALGRHTHARTHHLMMVRSLLSGGASRGPCLSSAQLACEAPTPKQTSPCRWYDPIRSMESVIDASADIYGVVACVHGRHTYIHTESGWPVQHYIQACTQPVNQIEWLRSHGRGRTRLLNTAISI